MKKLSTKNSIELKPKKVYLLKVARASYDQGAVHNLIREAAEEGIKIITILADDEKQVAIREDIAGELTMVDWSSYLISNGSHVLPHCKDTATMAAICSKLAVLIRNKIKEVVST